MGLGLQHTPPLPWICQALSSSSSSSMAFLAVFNLGKLFVVWIQSTFRWHPWMATLPCLTLARISAGTHRRETPVQTERICRVQAFIPQVPSLNQAAKDPSLLLGVCVAPGHFLPGNLLPTNKGTCLESLVG